MFLLFVAFDFVNVVEIIIETQASGVSNYQMWGKKGKNS